MKYFWVVTTAVCLLLNVGFIRLLRQSNDTFWDLQRETQKVLLTLQEANATAKFQNETMDHMLVTTKRTQDTNALLIERLRACRGER